MKFELNINEKAFKNDIKKHWRWMKSIEDHDEASDLMLCYMKRRIKNQPPLKIPKYPEPEVI